MKKMKLYICVLAIMILAAACIGCYYWYVDLHPRTRQGGILVHEHNGVYPDEQKC